MKLKDNVNILTVSEKDVTYKRKISNWFHLNRHKSRAMKDLDYGIINGNLVISSGHKLKEALELEKHHHNTESSLLFVMKIKKSVC